MARDKGVSGFRTAALMIGLGTFMMLLSVKHLPDVWTAYARLETGCRIVESSIRDNGQKETFEIYLDLRWRVDGSDYGTSKPELWREKRQKHSSLDYLLATYVNGEYVPCFYEKERPSRVYPEKAKGTELGWLVIMGLVALALVTLGSFRIVRRVRRPERHTVTIRDGVSYDYVPSTNREGSAVTPAIKVWQPVFESLGFNRPDDDAFRYSCSTNGVSVHIFLAELDDQTAVLGFKRPPLTIRFDHPDGKREVYFWARYRRRDDPMPKERQFWVLFDAEIESSIEITGYDAKVVAAYLDERGRRLLRELVVDHQLTVYAGQQKSVELDVMSIENTAEGERIIRLWIDWMSHVFDSSRSWEERLQACVLSDPNEWVRIHRLLVLVSSYPDSPVTLDTLNRLSERDSDSLARLSRALRGDHRMLKQAGTTVSKHMEAFWETDGFSLPLAKAALQQLIEVLPSSLDGPVIEGLLSSDNHGLVEECLKLLERRKELSDACETALIDRLDSCAYPIAMRCIHLLGHRGSLRSVPSIEPYTQGSYRLSDLAEAAFAAIEKIKRRSELMSDDRD